MNSGIYKYVIVDDNDTDRLLLSLYLKEYPFMANKASFSVPEDGLIFFENNNADILFLDIEMDNINGLEFLDRIKNKVKCAIFTTSHSEFALDGFELKAKDYLIKPISKDRLRECVENSKRYLEMIDRAEAYDRENHNNTVMLKSGTSYISVNPNEILYLEALKDYTKVILYNKKIITIHGNLGSLLRSKYFNEYLRIHKSYAVKQTGIIQVCSDKIILKNNISLPLGANYMKSLVQTIKDFELLSFVNK